MPIEKAKLPHWNGADFHVHELLHPTWDEIDQAIKTLDQQQHQEVYLYPDADDSDTWLAIVGGSGSYVATGSIANARFPTYINSSVSETTVRTIMAGSQLSEFQANCIISLEQAINVAKLFFNVGGFECEVEWNYL